jgi:hypothetical protein
MTRLTATEAARQFSDLLNRAYYRGESFELERNGQIVARLLPPRPIVRVKDLRRVLSPSGDESFAADLEAAQNALNVVDDRDPWAR